MTKKVWFDVEWSDAQVDKARQQAKQSGQEPPARKYQTESVVTPLMEHSQARQDRVRPLRRCSTQDGRELPSTVYRREGIRI